MSQQQVFYIHGAETFTDHQAFLDYLRTKSINDLPGAVREGRWSNSLREELGDSFEVFMPSMPNKQNARYVEWKIWFERHFSYLEDGVILVGWSQGGYFLAKYLIENSVPFKVKALFLLAAPFPSESVGGEGDDDFAFDTKEIHRLSTVSDKIYIFHSEDDYVVPFSHAKRYQAALPEATFVQFTDMHHFLVPELPELIDTVQSVAASK